MNKKRKPWQPVLEPKSHWVESIEYQKVLDELAEIIYSSICQPKSDPKKIAIEADNQKSTHQSLKGSGSK